MFERKIEIEKVSINNKHPITSAYHFVFGATLFLLLKMRQDCRHKSQDNLSESSVQSTTDSTRYFYQNCRSVSAISLIARKKNGSFFFVFLLCV